MPDKHEYNGPYECNINGPSWSVELREPQRGRNNDKIIDQLLRELAEPIESQWKLKSQPPMPISVEQERWLEL